MKPTSLTVQIAGHALVLSNLRASFDPALCCLFVADAHFGKDAVFRARGIPVPIGSTADNLLRLDILIAEFEPTMLVFLGDLLHARESHAPETLNALHAWRARHARLRVVLVEGNHDRHAGALPGTLGVEYVREPWMVGPWALCHEPQAVDGAYALAGHVHPVYRITTRTDSVRVPCFRFGTKCGVLPAFGSFTGGAREEGREAGERVFLVVQERVIEVGGALR
jgi:DNA ligase-associated metallophosphoesterase